MHILILGARSPAALEWVRACAKAQHSVTVADSLALTLSRFSRYTKHYLLLPAPAQQAQTWLTCLLNYIQQHKVNFLLPTCEEVFYVAHYHQQLSQYCKVLCSPLALLSTLHNKFSFAQFSQDLPITAPATQLITNNQQLTEINTSQLVLKPAYSRFACQTLICPTPQQLKQIQATATQPWLAQQYIQGSEICSFSLMQDGKLLAHSCYQPTYRIGKGAGIYLVPVDEPEITRYVQAFAEKTQLTGQVAFDFIKNAQGISVIECNPRATSGVHLFAQPEQLIRCLTDNIPVTQHFTQAKQMSLALVPLFFSKQLITKQFWQDIRQASDIIWNSHDPIPSFAQALCMLPMFARSLKLGLPVLACTTVDIEWNGQAID